jgi:hypothetical protein
MERLKSVRLSGRAIYAYPAKSLEGLRIKAEVARQYLNPGSG